MTYKHDAVIRAWLDGKTVQHYSRDGRWEDIRTVDICVESPAFYVEESFRIKPNTIKYRRWLRGGNGCHSVGSISFEDSVAGTEKHNLFVKWIDTEWQEVEV